MDLHGHQRRVGYIEWHPTAENILLSAGFDHKVYSVLSLILYSKKHISDVMTRGPDFVYRP